ncbi:MAG: acetyl CoA synthetase [Thermoproteota archaeon]|nr:MAG: acetyl CoA synthetase [Candidatus Korarchaeota archaeon]
MNDALNSVFRPKSVAIVGASRFPGKIGYEILRNLKEYGYKGKIYPVNPAADKILGIKCYHNVLEVPGSIDLAIISIPAKFVPPVIDQLAEKGTKAAVVISSGFSEVGNRELEEDLIRRARRGGIRIIGPNVFGVLYSPTRLNATFGPRDVRPGKIAFITQSGALGIALMGWTVTEKIGLSAVVSVGNKADVDDADLLSWFREDENTKVVLIYMEGVVDGRRFLKEARLTTKVKPIIVLKAGRSKKGMAAASSHTGSMAGADVVYSASFKQAGVLRAENLEQAFDWAIAFSAERFPKGNKVVIITNGGGVGVMATDSCEAAGLEVFDPPEDLKREFKKYMPEFGSAKNPIDLTGMATHEEFRGAMRSAIKHKAVDCIIALYCETAVSDPIKIAEVIKEVFDLSNKPITATMIGGERVNEAMAFLKENGVPVYPDTERAVSAMAALVRWMERRSL